MYGKSTVPSGATRNSFGSLSSPTMEMEKTSPTPTVVLSTGGGRLILDRGLPAQPDNHIAEATTTHKNFRTLQLMTTTRNAGRDRQWLVSRDPAEIQTTGNNADRGSPRTG